MAKSPEQTFANWSNENLSWRYLINSSEDISDGISMGCLPIPNGEILPLRYHAKQEIYFSLQIEGELLMSDDKVKKLPQGDSVYILRDTQHDINNADKITFCF